MTNLGGLDLERSRDVPKHLIRLLQTFLVASIALGSGVASAEVLVANTEDWELTLDGRLNTFVSYLNGQPQPIAVATWTGVEDRSAGKSTISMTRIRSGFITNVLAFTLTKQLTESTKLSGRFGIWVGASQTRNKNDNPTLDAREVYLKVEGPWGSILAGRDISLYGRGGIMLNYDIEHGYGLGHPCTVRVSVGGACGHAGHGVLFPSFNAGFVYSTPKIGGLQVSVGAYDPVGVSERSYERTPYPRIEGEVSFSVRKNFRIFLDGVWQQFGNNTDPLQNPDASGLSAGGMVQFGPVQLGGTGYMGQGLGLYVPLENSPLFADEMGIVRKSKGWLGLASLTFGGHKVAAGAGASILEKTGNEPEGPFGALAGMTIPKQQMGISAGYYLTIKTSLILAFEYFRATYDWFPTVDPASPDPANPTILQPRQAVNFVNVGATMIF